MLRSDIADERQRKALAQPVEVDVVPVKARHHGDAGEAAFRSLARQNERQLPAAREVELVREVHERSATA